MANDSSSHGAENWSSPTIPYQYWWASSCEIVILPGFVKMIVGYSIPPNERKPVRTTSISGYGNVPSPAEYASSDWIDRSSAILAASRVRSFCRYETTICVPPECPRTVASRPAAHSKSRTSWATYVVMRRRPLVSEATAVPVVGVRRSAGTFNVTW